MFDSFSIALSGLVANSVGVNVIGNNLANMNTTGFKGSSVSFHDLVAQSLGMTGPDTGAGTGTPTVMRQFIQGPIQPSGNPLDAAIQGSGFFVVRDQTGQFLFTRAGSFHLDAMGNLLTATGEKVQGWNAANGTPNTSGAIGNIVIPAGALRAPTAATTMSIDANLNAGTANGGTFSAPVEVVDSLGNKHVLTVTFTNNGTGSWQYAVSIPGEDLTSGTAGTPSAIANASGTLTFDNQGKLKTPAAASGNVSIQVTGLADGAADMNITWSLYGPDKTPRLTQFAQPSAVSATSQDGVAAGEITSIGISDGGSIVAHYSNGQQQVVAQLALALIQNPESLAGAGNNNLQASADTAPFVTGAPDSGGRGGIVGGSLEASTVDMAREFTNLIVMERSYQANARVITATDEISQETVSLKR